MFELRTLRVDAVHDDGGELTRFYPVRHTRRAAQLIGELEQDGWLCDAYVATWSLPSDGAAELVLRMLELRAVWPNTTTERLFAMMSRRPEFRTLDPATLLADENAYDDRKEAAEQRRPTTDAPLRSRRATSLTAPG
jgi:hypothetical protein